MVTNLYIYSGLGNIIGILDSLSTDLSINSEDIVNLYKNTDIEFDQLIMVLPPQNHEHDLDVKIFNNDGSTASNCINGARCVSKFIQDESLLPFKDLKVNTKGGLWHLKAISDKEFSASFLIDDKISKIELTSFDEPLNLDCIDLGNPHGVTFSAHEPNFEFLKVGENLQNNEYFPDGVNFGLANKVDEYEINLRVFERGAGETLACGSGACAAAVIGILKGELCSPVKVNFQLGSLLIDYEENSKMLSAKGEATFLEIREITI